MKKHVVGYVVFGILAVGASSATAASLITGAQIKNNSVTGFDVRTASLNGTDIKNRSIGPSDLSSSAKTSGPAGIANVTEVNSADVPVAPGDVGGATAACPAGSVIIGTGFDTSVGNIGFVLRFGNLVGLAALNDTPIPIVISAQAICASGPGVSTPATLRSVSSAGSFERKLAAFKAAQRR